MGSWGHLLCVSLLLCVSATVTDASLHTVGPCLVDTGKASFHCGQKKLTKIPEEIWTNVTRLDLSDNGLILSHPDTPRTLQKFEKLVHLNLSANYLPLLDRGLFSNLPSLEVLDLSRCQLSVMDTEAFEGLPRLQRLFLGHNRLQPSVSTALKELRGVLSYLDLQGNPRDSSAPYDERKGAQKVTRFKASKGHVHDHDYEGFKEKRISGKVNHRKLLAEDPFASTTPVPSTTLNDTAPVRVPAHNWKFLVGVLITAITLSIIVAVLAKCKLLHQYLASYRHSRFTNIDSESHYDPDVYEVGFASRGGAATISNGIADHDDEEEEEEGDEEDDDGFIEDNYIQPSERERAARAAQQQVKEEEEDLDDDLEFTIG
ncbi:type III endosome membrane protein TEMP [Alosa sapidissima]|uniref:type III endosome membrane protein TEMP n=1 Tax=Alosa sapidissima TaxID=34773 RepID=UPI001C0983D9|nr:type III endosome membrane protein TEMP [Alosa sapidissima]